ncbi:MAG: peptide deformylase [Spirochaetales bacterium]|nr:peptide deformylase [Spirochaetales bacterium]
MLRKTSAPVKVFHSKFHKFLDKLSSILKRIKNGAGLAVPQIGILKRVSIINCENRFIELINPEIIHMTGEHYARKKMLKRFHTLLHLNQAVLLLILFYYGNILLYRIHLP